MNPQEYRNGAMERLKVFFPFILFLWLSDAFALEQSSTVKVLTVLKAESSWDEPLAKLTLQGDFSLLWAKAGGAGGHFWHDTVTETNIITPAKWILPNAN